MTGNDVNRVAIVGAPKSDVTTVHQPVGGERLDPLGHGTTASDIVLVAVTAPLTPAEHRAG